MDAERRARWKLARVPGLGLARAWRMLREAPQAAAWVDEPAEALVARGCSERAAHLLGSAELKRALDRELADAEKYHYRWIFPQLDAAIPELAEIDVPPLLLAAQGNLRLLEAECVRVAVVGARTPTPYGVAQATRFAAELSGAGAVVVSGFARGVDRAAHRAALEHGGGSVGVLGSGLLEPYPTDDRALLEKMQAEGLLVSEFPLRMGARREHFPRRNRLISGMSRGVLVVEAGRASGSLVTARWALDQNRDVWAIPGRVDSPMSEGCHFLIREGAALAEAPETVLVDVGLSRSEARGAQAEFEEGGRGRKRALSPGLSEAERGVLEAAREGATLDELAATPGAKEEELFSIVVSLEMRGLLRRAPGGYYYASSR